MGYFSGREFDHVLSDLEKSYNSSLHDFQEKELKGKDHKFQPFDFFTSRVTKNFFKEDYVNLTKAATNKGYI